MAGWNNQNSPLTVLVGIHEGGNGLISLNEREMLNPVAVRGDFSL